MSLIKRKIPDSSFGKLTSNVVSLLAIQVSNYALPLISIPYFTRIVGPEKFGTISFIGAIIAYFGLLINYGFDTTATRDIVMIKDKPKLLNQLCSEVFYCKSLLGLVSVLVYILLIQFIPQLKEELYVSNATFLICIAYVINPIWLFQGFQDSHVLAFYNLLSKVLFTVAVLTAINVTEDYVLYPLFLSLSQILIGIIAFVRIRYTYNIRIVKSSISDLIIRLKDSKQVFISFFIINLYTTTNIVIIGFFENDQSVGLLSAALKVMALLQACLSIPFSQALFPFVGQKFKNSKEDGLRVVQIALPVVLFISLVCCLACSILSPLIVTSLFGVGFSGAATMLSILSFIPLVVVYSQFLGIQIMINLNMDKTFKKVIMYGAIGGVAINLVGGYVGGAVGISITYLLAELTIAALFTYFLRKENVYFTTLFAKVNKGFFAELTSLAKKVV